MEGLEDMTQPELYKELKRLNPVLAVGKSKARRNDLASLLTEQYAKVPDSSPDVVTPAVPVASTPKKRKRPRKIKITLNKHTDWTGPQIVVGGRMSFPNKPIIPFSAQQKEEALKLLDDVELVGNLAKHMRISPEKISGLIALATGVNSEMVVKVLEAFFDLKNTFTATREQAA